MALSDKAKKRFIVAMARRVEAQEILDAIESGSNPQAVTVANFGTVADLTLSVVAATTFTPSAGTFAVPGEPTAAEVNATIDEATAKVKAVVDVKADNADVETLRGEVETRLDNIETKINAVLTALKNAGLMA